MEKIMINILDYLKYLNENSELLVSVHFDYYNNQNLPQLDELSVYNTHSNPYCLKVKGEKNNFNKCILFQKECYNLSIEKRVIIKSCHSGIYQFISAIEREGKVIGFVAVCGYKGKVFVNETDIPLFLCDTLIPPLVVMLEKFFSSYRENANNEYNAIIQYLNEYHIAVNLLDLSRYISKSKSHISHIFKKTSGITIKEYCNNLKLEDAKNLLLTTSLSVTEIAYDCGFNDVSYFISLFRKKYKLSPLKFRQNN